MLVEFDLGWGLGDLVCAEPMTRGLREKYGETAEIRYRGQAGNTAFSGALNGPADDNFAPHIAVPVRSFHNMTPEEYGALETQPSLVDHMSSYGGVQAEDRSPRLWLTEEELSIQTAIELDTLPRPLVAICADSSDRYRGWSPDRYQALTAHVAAIGGTVLEVGLRETLGVGADLVGELDIRRVAALIAACDLFIGNSSGLLHYAQAADVPCIGLFSLAMPERFIHDRRLVIPVQMEELGCIDCTTKQYIRWTQERCVGQPEATCMKGLSIERVTAAVDRVFDGYLSDCPTPGQEGPKAREFRAQVLMEQATKLLERGYGARAQQFREHAQEIMQGVPRPAIASRIGTPALTQQS